MVIDYIENWKKYAPLHPGFERAFQAIIASTEQKTSLGKHIVDSERIFLNIQSYESKSSVNSMYENHQNYIDIHYIVKGKEMLCAADQTTAELHTPYNTEIDAAFTHAPAYFTTATLTEGMFAILFPGETHLPGLSVGDDAETVQKIVAKVKVTI